MSSSWPSLRRCNSVLSTGFAEVSGGKVLGRGVKREARASSKGPGPQGFQLHPPSPCSLSFPRPYPLLWSLPQCQVNKRPPASTSSRTGPSLQGPSSGVSPCANPFGSGQPQPREAWWLISLPHLSHFSTGILVGRNCPRSHCRVRGVCVQPAGWRRAGW